MEKRLEVERPSPEPVHDPHLHIGHLSSRLSEHHDKQVSKLKSFS